MHKMKPGDRFVACLRGERVDRVPFGVGLGFRPWNQQILDRWARQAGREKLDLHQEFGYDLAFANPKVNLGVHPPFDHQILSRGEGFVVSRDWRGILRRDREDGESMPEFIEYPVKTPDDWETFKGERWPVDGPARVSEDWTAFRDRLAQTGEGVQVGWFPFGVFGTPRDTMGDEELLVSFYEYPDMVRDMMDRFTTVWLAVYEEVARQVRIDHIHIWEDMAGRQGSLISPAMVEAFMMPSYDRISAFAREHEVRLVSVDTDGDPSQLVPVMTRHGVTAMFPFEVAAGCDVFEFRRLHPTLGIWGGLDKRALTLGRHAIDHEMERAAGMIRLGRFIPMFDHLIPPDVAWPEFEYAMRRLKGVCCEVKPPMTA